MRTEQPTKCLYDISYGGCGYAHKTSLSPQVIHNRSKAVVLMRFSVACFGVRVSVLFHPMFVHYTISSVWVAEWPPFGK